MNTIFCEDGPHRALYYNVLGDLDEFENVHGKQYTSVRQNLPDGTPIYIHVGDTIWTREKRKKKAKQFRQSPAWSKQE